MKTSATPRKPSRNASRPAASAILLEPPRKDARRGDLHDERVRRAQRGLARILRVLPVEQVAPAAEARPALDDARAALDHHAAQRAPGIRIGVDDDRHPGILGDILHLASVVAGADDHLAAAQRVADRHHVRDARGAAGGDAAHALPLNELRALLRESHRLAAWPRVSPHPCARAASRAACVVRQPWMRPTFLASMGPTSSKSWRWSGSSDV